ncbi:hypothetical protein [Streptomyces chryseus]|uniref:hypothetical protein n=1 Tax=Streptomyces chryseus TaxID=68186 RepID=UPI00110FC9B5|nr:hypothetical protein [Streptomyces chryseus]GGX24366.1 hypothetical protein GCM10010353_44170 [Streptomyces chryseus]
MARHSGRRSQRSALLRAGLAVTAAGAALAAGGGAAQAAPVPKEAGIDVPLENFDPAATGRALTGGLGAATAGGVGPVKDFHPNPLAGTGVDPLDNGLGTQVADFQPLSTAAVTAPLTQGDALRELPLAGPATGLLPG